MPGLSGPLRSVVVFGFDLFAVVVAWLGGLLIRFNFQFPPDGLLNPTWALAVLLCGHAIACRWAGLYRGMWTFASLPDLGRVLRAVGASWVVLLHLIALSRTPGQEIPRSLIVLYPLLLLLVMAGGRLGWRMLREHKSLHRRGGSGKPVVVVGAGSAGAMLVQSLDRSPDWRVVALVDDDSTKWGREVHGHLVAGAIGTLAEVVAEYKAGHVVLAMPSARGEVLRRAAALAAGTGARVLTVPGVNDLLGGKVTIGAMRPVNVEDLLGREPVRIDSPDLAQMISGKTVLVTGAGGSIGSELCRQLARFGPSRLVLFESSEYALYNVEQWFHANRPEQEVVALAGDVKDTVRLQEVFVAWRPTLVFHAAAYKHVPLMEVGNAWQAVRNNVQGTLLVAAYAMRMRCEHFVLISTDKAVNPTNVMGATKRLAEMTCEALSQLGAGVTRLQIVRFGNVLGSTGSVIPKFAEQIARGGPVTVTHPEINRFFMSIPEAAQLVLQAASLGRNGEIFVLDMGEPVKIADLARNMIRLSGYGEDEIRIEFTGLRPGEKLYEELLADAEETRATAEPKLRVARSRPVPETLLDELSQWLAQAGPLSDDAVRTGLMRWVPEYEPARHLVAVATASASPPRTG
ncbi:MAG: polysaccharide biosynthesis protein [Thauera sp.]|nr:polysaccharide biosynthesis protein [Thauera sp.]